MVDRLLLTLIIGIILIGSYRLFTRYTLQKRVKHGLELDHFLIGRPAILYFTTPGCVPCRTIQRPALDLVRAELEQTIQIIEIDALAQPDLADKWGVLSVPTTFIIDGRGRPRRVNNGTVKAEKLIGQIRELSEGISSANAESDKIDETLQDLSTRMD
jgi:thiol-disulfide isomerase/thioredoxin